MEAVPHVVKPPDDAAQEHEKQKTEIHKLFFEADFFGGKEQQTKEYRNSSAGDIRNSVGCLGCGAGEIDKVCNNVFQSPEHADKIVGAAHVDRKIRREAASRGVGVLKSKVSGQQEKRRHAYCDQGEAADPDKVKEELLDAFPANDMIYNKYEQHKNAGEKSDIIVCKERQGQSDRVQPEIAVLEQGIHSQRNKRRYANGVKPNGVPVIAHKKRAERKADAKEQKRNIVAVVDLAKKISSKGAAERDFEHNREHQKFSQPFGRQKYSQKVERTCKVVGHKRKIVYACAHRPVPKQRFAVLELVLKVSQKRIVLVPVVNNHDLLVRGSERRNVHQTERQRHKEERSHKGADHINVIK